MSAQPNIYECPLGHQLVTVHADEGTTPFMVRCRTASCSETAYSRCYQVHEGTEKQATHEWYRPGADELAGLSEGMRGHVEQGGLLLRERAAVQP